MPSIAKGFNCLAFAAALVQSENNEAPPLRGGAERLKLEDTQVALKGRRPGLFVVR